MVCSLNAGTPPFILALGFGEERAYGSVRFGLGRGNQEDNIHFTVALIGNAVQNVWTIIRT